MLLQGEWSMPKTGAGLNRRTSLIQKTVSYIYEEVTHPSDLSGYTNKHLYSTGTFDNKLLLGYRVEATIVSPTLNLPALKEALYPLLTGPFVDGVLIAEEVRKPYTQCHSRLYLFA